MRIPKVVPGHSRVGTQLGCEIPQRQQDDWYLGSWKLRRGRGGGGGGGNCLTR